MMKTRIAIMLSLGLNVALAAACWLARRRPESASETLITRSMTIRAPQARIDTPYVQSLRVNGQVSTKPWLPESFVANGGELDFTLSASPNLTWGSAPADAPPSFRPPK